jgi:hypothetical protein
MKSDIRNIWSIHSRKTGNEILKNRLDELNHLNCYIGTILVSKAKIFSLEIDIDTVINKQHLRRFSGVEIQVLDTDTRELVIILLETDLTDIFIVFIEDIIAELFQTKDVQSAVDVISRKVSYWKRLFGKYSTGILSPQEQRGLFGELSLMLLLLENEIVPNKVVSAWRAPTGTNQDYYFGDVAVEVKTSKSNKPVIKISNEYQMDSSGYKGLYLAFFRLIETPSGNDTLIALIYKIRELLKNPESLREFDTLINYLGITNQVEEEYKRTSYEIRKVHYFKVTEGFPRITEDMIDGALSNVSYEIYPKGCSGFEISFEELTTEILNAEHKN